MNAIIIIALAGIATLFIGVFKLRNILLSFIILACLAALSVIIFCYNGNYTKWLNGMLQFDVIATTFSVLLITLSIIIFLFSKFYYSNETDHLADIYGLMLFSLAGAVIMVSYNNLVMLFMGIEILSIPLYVLAASNRRNLLSNEAGLKYFVMGAFASSFLLLGITLVYGITGTFSIEGITQYILHGDTDNFLFVIGSLLILSAFLFKVSAAPFHSWAPDVYQGSPTLITAFMSTVVKTAAFGTFIKFITIFMQSNVLLFQNVLSVVAILTMFIGNIIALYQSNLKRLLAYSGISNAGYVMVAMATHQPDSYQYVFYYLAVYSLASIAAFVIYFIIKKQTDDDTIDGLKGLASRNKILAFCLSACMLSLAGIPPLAGFLGKYGIFINAIEDGRSGLVVIAVINSLIGVYYYFKVMNACYQGAETEKKIISTRSINVLLIAVTLLLFILGVYPSFILQYL
ncbi:MAG: NADH-quinone oxidoreductase subunit N [Chitinophagales bacterium]